MVMDTLKLAWWATATFSVHYGSRALLAFTFQVSCRANLLGFDLFYTLGFSITDNTGATY